MLFYILAILHHRGEYSNDTNLDAVEHFSGKAQVTRSFIKLGLNALSFDILDDSKYEDINGVWGFCCALQHLRRVVPSTGFAWLGAVCSTWLFLFS